MCHRARLSVCDVIKSILNPFLSVLSISTPHSALFLLQSSTSNSSLLILSFSSFSCSFLYLVLALFLQHHLLTLSSPSLPFFSLLPHHIITFSLHCLPFPSSHSVGAIGSGTGILLAVTIIYQYYEMFEKINADPNAFVA